MFACNIVSSALGGGGGRAALSHFFVEAFRVLGTRVLVQEGTIPSALGDEWGGRAGTTSFHSECVEALTMIWYCGGGPLILLCFLVHTCMCLLTGWS